MPGMIARLNEELENIGKRAQAALEEGRLQVELYRLRRKQNNAAGDLGKLVHGRERGKEVAQARIDALLLQLDDLEAAIEKVEKQMGAVKVESETVEEGEK